MHLLDLYFLQIAWIYFDCQLAFIKFIIKETWKETGQYIFNSSSVLRSELDCVNADRTTHWETCRTHSNLSREQLNSSLSWLCDTHTHNQTSLRSALNMYIIFDIRHFRGLYILHKVALIKSLNACYHIFQKQCRLTKAVTKGASQLEFYVCFYIAFFNDKWSY